MSEDNFIGDDEIAERMREFYDEIIPAEKPVEEDQKKPPPIFDYSEEAVNAILIARTLLNEPFLNFSDLIKATGLNKGKVMSGSKWLLKNGFVEEHQIGISGSGKPGKYFEVTSEALELLDGKPPAGRGSFKHKCYCHKIKDFFIHQGLDVHFEARLEGMRGAFDLLASKKGFKSFGVEVTLSFKNLTRKCR